MIVDACAMVAVFRLEPKAEKIKEIMGASPVLLMSAVTLTECCLVTSRQTDLSIVQIRNEIESVRIEIVPTDAAQAVLAAEARHRFPIRFGDAFVYALAKSRNLPVLTLDAEFAKTDADLVSLA